MSGENPPSKERHILIIWLASTELWHQRQTGIILTCQSLLYMSGHSLLQDPGQGAEICF